MLFFDIFKYPSQWPLTILAFVFLAMATFNANRLKQSKGLWQLFLGLFLLCMLSGVHSYANFFYHQAVSVKILVLSEMLLVLASSIILAMASSQILMHKPLNIGITFGFITIGLTLVIYAIFIADNANIIFHLQKILPIIGMSYVFLSFISRNRLWVHHGELMAGIAAGGFVTIMTFPTLFPPQYVGLLSVFLVFVMGFSYYPMLISELNKRIELQNISQQRAEKNIDNIIKSSPFPIVISRLSDDMLIMANNNAIKLFGLASNEMERYHLKDFFVDTENRRLLTERLEKDKEVHDFEILVKTATGNTPFWLLASVNLIDYNNVIAVYAAFQDITSRKHQEVVLQSQADRDPLTSIYNRRYFEKKATEKIAQLRDNKEPFAFLMIDADNFKNINDTFGHKIGDKVLIELASVCERTLRPDDIIARYGGEEFVVFLKNVTLENAQLVAERLRENISNCVVYSDDNQPVRFTVSIGIAVSGISDSTNIMIKMADDAMYLAKQNGKNRVEHFNEENISRLAERQASETKEKAQLHPIFSGDDEEISLLDGIEANHIIED